MKHADEVGVLYVDDDLSLRDLLPYMLDSVDERLEVTTLGDPTEVVDTLQSGPQVECVVCDYDMPQRNGLEVFEAVREVYPDLPFILYTGKGSEEIASEAISAGVTDYIQKDSGTEHYELLANRITEYVHRYRADRQYALTEQRYRRLLEQSVVGIAMSQDGVFEYANPEFAKLFGYAVEELVGEPVFTIIADEDRDRVERALERRETGAVESVHYVVTGVDKHGNHFDVEVHGSRVTYDGQPAVLGVVQPLETNHPLPATVDQGAVRIARDRLEHTADLLVASETDDDSTGDVRRAVEAAVDTAEAAIDTVTDDQLSEERPTGTVDLGTRCRLAWEESAKNSAALTVVTSPSVVADSIAVDRLFGELFAELTVLDRSLSVVLDETAAGFELTVDPADRTQEDLSFTPPTLSRIVELLDWDVYISETDCGGVVYSFEGVELA